MLKNKNKKDIEKGHESTRESTSILQISWEESSFGGNIKNKIFVDCVTGLHTHE